MAAQQCADRCAVIFTVSSKRDHMYQSKTDSHVQDIVWRQVRGQGSGSV